MRLRLDYRVNNSLFIFCKKLQSMELLFVLRVILGPAGHGGHADAQQMIENIVELLWSNLNHKYHSENKSFITKENIYHATKVRLFTVGFLGSPAAEICHVKKSTLEDFFFATMQWVEIPVELTVRNKKGVGLILQHLFFSFMVVWKTFYRISLTFPPWKLSTSE